MKRDGYGSMSYATSGDKYSGEWSNGLRVGQGTMDYKTGDRYTGEWKQDQYSGNGIYTYKKGDRYEGEWLANKKHGFGQIRTAANGEEYVGSWKNDFQEGEGTLSFVNKIGALTQRYSGSWMRGKYHGFGVQNNEGREVGHNFTGSAAVNKQGHPYLEYRGDWRHGLRVGKGRCVYKDSSEYNGSWQNDVRMGHGTLHRVDGRIDEGTWIDDILRSHEVLNTQPTLPTRGSQLVTQTQIGEDGSVYVGELVFGRRYGQGMCRFPNGDIYEGGWDDNKYHGQVEEEVVNNAIVTPTPPVLTQVVNSRTRRPAVRRGRVMTNSMDGQLPALFDQLDAINRRIGSPQRQRNDKGNTTRRPPLAAAYGQF
eukprot:gene39484-48792_t